MSATETSVDKPARLVSLSPNNLMEVVEVHRAAFTDYMNTSLGTGYLTAFLRGFMERTDTIHLVALDERNQVLGYLAGAPITASQEMNQKLIPAACIAVITHPWLLFGARVRSTIWTRLTGRFRKQPERKPAPDLPPNSLSLVSVGVHPARRGRKVGELLVQSFEKEAMTRGIPALRLSVYPDNKRARQFYERLGWQSFREDVPPGNAMYYYKQLVKA